ncbi:hypothetical protein P167DRAFT_578405 [Morchella conica CCBAS932]|uniref:Stc1 domain-containing protein n=1 Tax=Morchella conica CCBAS932 TaxID=1392247 RepID=A0A3N4KRA6_9PEZI|nr:hypothetical protein P167DRAFT_578405 [Morchella conica CCBAS932]
MGGRGIPSAPGGAKRNAFDKKPGAAAGANRDGGAPSQIRCAVCKKTKSREEFSNRQLLKFTSYNKGSRTTKKDVDSVHVTCTLCTAGQTVELKCYVCDKVKGLHEFAKNQRKDPDNARCIKCVDSDITAEPDLHADHPNVPVDSSSEDEEEEEHNWDAPARSTANQIRPYRPQNKKTDWASTTGEDDDDEYDDVSSSATSQYSGPPRQQGFNLPARPGTAQRAPAVFNYRANQPSNSYAGRAPPVEDDDDEWETMSKTKSIGGSSRASSTASPSGYSSQLPATRKGGWAKVAKGVPEGDDPWANYGKK